MAKLCLKPGTMMLCAVLVLAVSQTTNTQYTNAQRPLLDPTVPHHTTQDAISAKFNNFDVDLLRSFDASRNYIISPASIKATLLMILEGARGESAEEIASALNIPLDTTRVRQQLNGLIYNAKSGTTLLETANAAFVSNNYQLVPGFEKNLAQHYNAKVRHVNFANNQAAAAEINQWVSDATQGKINEIVNSANFNADASLVLANALYFKGKWKHEFDERSTSIKCFHKTRSTCVQTSMMQTVNNFNYKNIEELAAQAIELPYGDGQYALLVLVPTGKNNVEGLMRDLLRTSFAAIVDKLEPTEVMVNLPKFDVEYTTDLVAQLQNLGIKEVFSPHANLSGIIQGGDVKVNNIMHKATIEVNEKGTVASAATGVVVIPLMGSSMPRFDADRPFLFFIYHVQSRGIIFEGRFNEPVDVYQQLFPPTNSKPVRQPPRQPVANNPQNLPNRQAATLSIDSVPVPNPQQSVVDGLYYPHDTLNQGSPPSLPPRRTYKDGNNY